MPLLNPSLFAVFEAVQCGLRNHLRGIVLGIETISDTCIPQFVSVAARNSILNGSHEHCHCSISGW